jgi:hypothetical protein
MFIDVRFQRVFLTWLEELRERLAVPVTVLDRSSDMLDLDFGDAAPMLGVSISSDEIMVSAEWKGDCVDLLFDAEVEVSRVPGGYVCGLCEPEKREVFPTRDALWRDHLFEPFLRWVNENLAPARFLGLWRWGGMTAATLLDETGMCPRNGEAHVLLPLHGRATSSARFVNDATKRVPFDGKKE